MAPVMLEMSGITKSFGTVKVLHGVDLTLEKGEVHALIGQNGAGKSTLMKILNGVHAKDAGEMKINGTPVEYSTPLEARASGVGMVFQEFSLVPSMTVAENIFLCSHPYKRGILLDDTKAMRRARELLDEVGVDVAIPPDEYVENLSIGSRQIVEIAKALSLESKILVLDEPTASLSHAETDSLFRVIRNLKAKGISIIYITHYLKDVFQICDGITVLRDGLACMTSRISDTSIEEVINAMLGEKLQSIKQPHPPSALPPAETPLLAVNNLSTSSVKDISLQLWPGEIIGLAGLLGSGRTEILQALFGIDRIEQGEIVIQGMPAHIQNSTDAFEHGLAMVPEDRRHQGLILEFSIKENMMLPILRRLVEGVFINDAKGRELVQKYFQEFNIKAKHVDQTVKFLSGGNQQKVVVAKNIANQPKILLLDDPTFGIDVHSKLEIMTIVRNFVNQGNGAILISSEFDEIATYCDRVLIVRKGRIVESLSRTDHTEITEEKLLTLVQ